MEQWKDIPGYEGKYQVSDLGQIRSLNSWNSKGRIQILKQGLNSSGYSSLGLCKDGKRKTFMVSHLVIKAFVPDHVFSRKFVVDHIDKDRTNNRLDNLQIITQSENVKRSVK